MPPCFIKYFHYYKFFVLRLLLSALFSFIYLLPVYAGDMERPSDEEIIESILDGMTLEQKVGQLLFVGFSGTSLNATSRKWVEKRGVGGVALFSRNIKGLEQTARFTRELQALTKNKIPVFIALDHEGGNVLRVKEGAIPLPGNMLLGASRDMRLAYIAGEAAAVDLRRLGFNMNLAPVLDVNSNPKNPVIGVRSYGEKSKLVGDLGSWFIRGQQQNGVASVAKHFPGHGDTKGDSHYGMPAIDADMARLFAVELAPFKKAIDAGLDAIMTAHIGVPKVTGGRHVPATLSPAILDGILRKRLGFEGIVITDGLEMQGIVTQYGSGRAAVLAIKAGADMPMVLWTPKVQEEVYRTLIAAVKSGDIPVKRLDLSVMRILRTKVKRGLFEANLVSLADVIRTKNKNTLHQQVVKRISEAGITLVRNRGDLLPLDRKRFSKVVSFGPKGNFTRILAAELGVSVRHVPFVLSKSRRNVEVQKITALAKNADVLIAAAANRYHVALVKEVAKKLPHLPLVVVSLGSPYLISDLPDVDVYMCAYSYLDAPQKAAAEALLGLRPMLGRLPVSIPGLYDYGHRQELDSHQSLF